jgi:hypothetical protein
MADGFWRLFGDAVEQGSIRILFKIARIGATRRQTLLAKVSRHGKDAVASSRVGLRFHASLASRSLGDTRADLDAIMRSPGCGTRHRSLEESVGQRLRGFMAKLWTKWAAHCPAIARG